MTHWTLVCRFVVNYVNTLILSYHSEKSDIWFLLCSKLGLVDEMDSNKFLVQKELLDIDIVKSVLFEMLRLV